MRSVFYLVVVTSCAVTTISFPPPATVSVVHARAAGAVAYASLRCPQDVIPPTPKPSPKPTPSPKPSPSPPEPKPGPRPEPTPKPAPEPSPSPDLAHAPQLLIFTATWCQPCGALHREIDKLKSGGWTIGDEKMIRYVDISSGLNELSRKHGVTDETILPRLVIVSSGKELSHKTGFMEASQIKAWCGSTATGWSKRK
jgi:hypothetical protein